MPTQEERDKVSAAMDAIGDDEALELAKMMEETIRLNIDNLDIRLSDIPELGDLKLAQLAALISYSAAHIGEQRYAAGLQDGAAVALKVMTQVDALIVVDDDASN